MKRNKSLRIACILMALVLATTLGLVGTLARYVDTIDGVSATVRAGLFRVTAESGTDEFTFGAQLYVQGEWVDCDCGEAGCEDEVFVATNDGDLFEVDELLAQRDDALVDDDADGIIVPGTVIGTDGYIAVINESEVAVYIELDLEAMLEDDFIDAGPFADFLYFSFRDEDGDMMPWLTVTDFIDLLETDADAREAIVVINDGDDAFIPALAGVADPAEVTLNLYARWVFGDAPDYNEDQDSPLGIDAACVLLGDCDHDNCNAELPTFEITVPLRAVQVMPTP
jgi:hypothetical protein